MTTASDDASDAPPDREAKVERIIMNSFAGVMAEFLFVLLPLVILLIVYLNQGRGVGGVLRAPDWSFAAAILFGQAVVKLFAGVAGSPRSRPWERSALFATVVIVVGLVPSLIILSLMLDTAGPATSLVIVQFIWFILSAATFLVLGTAGHALLAAALRRKPPASGTST